MDVYETEEQWMEKTINSCIGMERKIMDPNNENWLPNWYWKDQRKSLENSSRERLKELDTYLRNRVTKMRR